MQYRENLKNGDQLSALGYGCMRLPKNEAAAEQLLLTALEGGINYFDTAYFYPGNEALLGGIIARNQLRPKMKLATKSPQYYVKKPTDLERYFTTELERLQTDYIDYYLMHMLTDFPQWERLRQLGAEEWIAAKKASGQVKNIGFSYHGGPEAFEKIIDAYPWDFCMIQYNYLDEHNQAGRTGLLYAAERGIPIMVMEPLQGGRLAANLPAEAAQLFQQQKPARSPAEWGLRWVLNHPQVLCVLSGMETQDILGENLRVADDATPGSLTPQEEQLFAQARQTILKHTKVPCTGCAYCMPCPAGVNIPLCFHCYNATATKGRLPAMTNYISYVWNQNASRCIGCGKCESHCPQSISIREKLSEAAQTLEGFPYRPMKRILKRVMNRTE